MLLHKPETSQTKSYVWELEGTCAAIVNIWTGAAIVNIWTGAAIVNIWTGAAIVNI